MIQEAIQMLIDGKDLAQEQAEAVMNQIMSGEATDAQIAGFLVSLRIKGEKIPEITACAKVMRQKAAKIKPKNHSKLVDIVGTGGDKTGTFNISTAAAIVVAGAGVPVAKHGNKSVSSRSGSADVLAELGVKIDLEPKQVERCISKIGIGYMFAPKFHGAMKYAIGPRKELAVRTIFNVLGPLTNPAEAPFELMGVFDPKLTEPMAEVLGNLGCRHALVVNGSGLDEATITGPTKISEFIQGHIRTYEIKPEDFGIKRAALDKIKGADPKENKKIIMSILEGKEKGPKRDVVVLNAALGIFAAEIVNDIKDGIKMAERSIDSGNALKKLKELVEFTNS
ncbi:MAG: anthranilate phosphoribosyltransferase [Nanoarchaeota archaeon]|nr:anthranilate phosphoribosyltransferase [Nanoarchaeota archaeon]MBU1704329.1 anthranilate phosphoribosyltransferase [Nanoarchaeota archaeon]